MAYHINAEGEVGPCKAQIRCPYGDFETEHYVTEQEARRAYEAAMEGKTFKPGLVLAKELNEPFEKFKAKKLKRIKSIEKPSQEIGVGYFVPGEFFVNTRKGDEILGGTVSSLIIDREALTKTYVINYETDSLTLTLAIEDDGYPPVGAQIWIDRPSHEEAQVRELEVSEYNMEVAAKAILPDMKRSLFGPGSLDSFFYRDEDGTRANLHWLPRAFFQTYSRKYLKMVDQAETAKIANPYNFALARLKKMAPTPDFADDDLFQKYEGHGRRRIIRLLEAVVTQNDAYKPDYLDRVILREVFDEGERPYVDYSFKKLGLKEY